MIKNQNHRLGAHSPISKADLEDTILQLVRTNDFYRNAADLILSSRAGRKRTRIATIIRPFCGSRLFV
jgi:hypothetical protein